MTVVGGRRDLAVEAVMIQLVRLATDSARSAASAATLLRAHEADELVLRRAQAKMSWALAERPSEVIERAAAILDGALSLGAPDRDIDHARTCGWPYYAPCPRCYPLPSIA
jgi:hypothetical protein